LAGCGRLLKPENTGIKEGSLRLGLVEIEANIVELPELKRQLAECDENLAGPTLSKAERALFTQRRKEIYEA